MKSTTCRQESRILEDARHSTLSETAQEHLATCETCGTALRVDRMLSVDADRVPSLDRLPDPTLVWWRARQQAQLRKAERATLPIQIAERLALGLGALGLVIGLFLTWPMVRAGLDQWLGSWARGFWQALPLDGSSLILALTGSLFLLLGFGFYTQSVER